MECRLTILHPFLGIMCPTCERRLEIDARNRAEIDGALSGLRPHDAVFGESRVYVVYVVSTLGEVDRKIVSEGDKTMAFKDVEQELSFSPDRLGDYVMGRLIGTKAMDNKPSVKMALVKTVRAVLDGEGNPVMVAGVDGEGKATSTPKVEPIVARIIDFNVVRAIEAAIPARGYDPNGANAQFGLFEVVGFSADEKKWPLYRVALGDRKDMAEELATPQRAGVAMVLHPRVNTNAAKPNANGPGATSGSTGGAGVGDDDIPF